MQLRIMNACTASQPAALLVGAQQMTTMNPSTHSPSIMIMLQAHLSLLQHLLQQIG
jgi:hypothetical protein